MKRLGRGLKWLILILIGIEVASFLVITASNYILYGHAREGGRVRYDPYTLFLLDTGARDPFSVWLPAGGLGYNPDTFFKQDTGVRNTAYGSVSPEPSRNRRIWLLGGSTMKGHGPADDKTIPSFLLRSLNESGSGLHYSGVNFGMSSFNSLLETKYLQKLFIESSNPPDIVIFFDGANDAKYFAEYRHPYGHHAFRNVRALVESYYQSWFGLLKPLNAALYASYSKELYDKVYQVAVPITEDDTALAQTAEAVERRYEHVARLCQSYGAQFLLFWQPMAWVEQCEPRDEIKRRESTVMLSTQRFATLRRNFTVPYEAMEARLRRKPYFVNLRNILCDRTSAAFEPDGVHLTDYGNQVIAEHMARVIQDRVKRDPAAAGKGGTRGHATQVPDSRGTANLDTQAEGR